MDNPSEMLSQTILDCLSDHIAVLDRAGTIILVNAAWKRFAEENGDVAMGQTGVGENYLTVCQQAKGDERKIALAALAGIEGVLAGKLQQFSSLEYPCHSRETERWFLFSVTPMPREIGGAVISHINVTERKQVEEQSRQQDRLGVVGQLATGIAHDFNNILAVITLYSQLLLKSPSISHTDAERLQVINKQAYRAARLIDKIMDFNPHSILERRPLELTTFLTTLTKQLKRTLPADIDITLNCAKNELLVNADITRLDKVFTNLATNARDAMPQGGVLHIEAFPLTLAADQLPPMRDIAPGQWISITISDTGMGIPPQTLPHIFEPFFSTKSLDKGIGLGLAQIYSTIKRHDGFINVISQVDQGTSFTIYLPALLLPDIEVPTPLSVIPLTGRGETILVVADDKVALEATADTLQSLNYTVLTAKNGKEAIRLFTKQAESIALVLSDLSMPVMDGVSLYQRLCKKRPDVKMILLTRSTTEIDSKTLSALGIIDYLAKPFNIEQVAQTIYDALGEQ